jgi:hypothetical protein
MPCPAAAPEPMPVARSAARPPIAGMMASGARIKPGKPLRRDRRRWCDGREALDYRHGGERAPAIKPGDRP